MTGKGSLRRATCNGQVEGNEKGTYTHYTSHERQCGIVFKPRGCAVSHDTISLVQPGRTGGMFLGQQLYGGTKSQDNFPIKLRQNTTVRKFEIIVAGTPAMGFDNPTVGLK